MSHDPRVIKIALEDLREETGRWSSKATQSLAASYQTHVLVREDVDRTLHRASVVRHDAQEDSDRVAATLAATSEQTALAESAATDAHVTLEEAQAAHSSATSVLSFWQDQLQKALAWLARAEARLERAIASYNAALTRVQSAKWELQRAESRYNACQRNKERTNCDREYRDVVSAQNELDRALHALQLAEIELQNAREEVAAAKARVACCSRAVDFGKKAVGLAAQAVSYGEQAVNSAERSLELVNSAMGHVRMAETDVAEEVQVAEQMVAITHEAVRQVDLANLQLLRADRSEESAQRNLHNADQALRSKLDHLWEMDRADLHA